MKNIHIISAFTLFLASCGQTKTTEEQPIAPSETTTSVATNSITLTPEQYQNAGIEIGKVSQQNMATLLKVNGKVDAPPQSTISISVPMGGYLKATKLLVGMPVRKGEVIATLEDVQYIQLQQDYWTAKAQLALTESEYHRQKELNQSKATSDKIYEQAKANYEIQQVLIKALAEKLKLIGLNPNTISPNNITKSIQIYAPINGFVSAVNENIGKYIQPSDVLFELINPNDMHLTLSVFDQDVAQLKIGQEVIAYSNNNPAQKYICKIIRISQNLSEANVAEVQCHFEQYDKSLIMGKFMNAEIALTTHDATTLPNDAIVRFENKHYVFVSQNDRDFEMIAVDLGSTENDFTAILNPEALANQNIVIGGAYNLLMSLKNKSED